MSSQRLENADAHWQQIASDLRERLTEAEEILKAIAEYKVDAFVMGEPEAERVYTLRNTDHAYQVILETINEGAATVGTDATIYYCNPAFADLLQLPFAQVAGKSLANFVSPEDLSLFTSLIEQGVAERSKGEIILQTAAGNPVSVLLSCSSLQLDDFQGACIVATDLTEQKRQAELVAAELLARSILEQTSAAMVVCNVEGRIIRANRKAHQLCGSNPLLHLFEEVLPLYIDSNDPSNPPIAVSFTVHLSNQEVQSQEVRLVHSYGDTHFLLLSSATLLDIEKQSLGNVITLVDITAHKQMEETLREARDELEQRVIERTAALLDTNDRLQQEIEERKQAEITLTEVRQRLSQSQETERLLLARELHDGPLQEVIGMTFDLTILSQTLQEDEQLIKVASLNNSIQKTARQLRLMAQTLRPPVLAHLGLAAALRAYIKQVQETKETPILDFISSEKIWSVPEETALALLRIVQQSVQNALQHAVATKIEVRLICESDQLRLEVEDNGRGFSKPYHRVAFAHDGHLGVVGMAERAEVIGGNFEVLSQPGQGTCIRVTIQKPRESFEEK